MSHVFLPGHPGKDIVAAPKSEFLIKLHNMLKTESPDIISWKRGQLWIHKPLELEQSILHKYFRRALSAPRCKYSSFQRQLNYYGFRKAQGKGMYSPSMYTNPKLEGCEVDALLKCKRGPVVVKKKFKCDPVVVKKACNASTENIWEDMSEDMDSSLSFGSSVVSREREVGAVDASMGLAGKARRVNLGCSICTRSVSRAMEVKEDGSVSAQSPAPIRVFAPAPLSTPLTTTPVTFDEPTVGMCGDMTVGMGVGGDDDFTSWFTDEANVGAFWEGDCGPSSFNNGSCAFSFGCMPSPRSCEEMFLEKEMGIIDGMFGAETFYI